VRRIAGLLGAIRANRTGRDSLPRFLTYIVTFTCNARCIMCDSWKKPSPDDLKLGEIAGIFDQLPRMDGVRLTGGEPFVRKDLPEIAGLVAAKLRPRFLHITTNGFLTERIVKFGEERDRRTTLNLLVSVDGVESKHNHVRGRETAWSSVMKTLHALAPRARELNLRLAVNQTIVDAEGIEHYRLLRDTLRPLGVRNNVVMAYDASATYSLKEVEVAQDQIGKFTTFGEFTSDHVRELIAEIERDLPSYPLADRIAKRYYLRGLRSRMLEGGSAPNPPCVALNSHLRLFPNGDVPVCQFNTRGVGNLRRESFAELWSGEPRARERDWVRRCKGCWAECEVLPSAVYTGDLARHVLPGGGKAQTGESTQPSVVASTT
jgi:MoaA/NifB/PqqE/SkfB family radical SAM enzyme